MTSPVSAIEAIENAMEGGYWAATIYDCRPPRSSRDNPLKHSRVVTVHEKFDTEAEALNAGAAAIKSGWAGSCAIYRENATHSATFELGRSSVTDLVRAIPALLALARQAEALQRENAELRDVMKECHAALKMMISPGDISGSTVLGAFAAAKSAEARARALLGGSENAE